MDSRIPITELSSLTRKSRPTIYKYLSLYQEKDYGSVPYAFVTLFKMMDDRSISKKEILDYIEYAKEKGCSMTGPEDPDIFRLNVLK